MLKQRSQKTTWSRTATSAAASVRASASGARSRWYVRRCAVLGPIPGRRANDSMSRATGSMTAEVTGWSASPSAQARDLEPARDRGHLLGRDLLRGAQRVVD